ncbi:HigA family addiction module antitoxin [Pedomonas sp. V897]|uniref:HigA family addiction module antitoxin n=1 Tax=Pedomonas sp. V897 TaxID=3446482 RepID=UPI003EE06206
MAIKVALTVHPGEFLRTEVVEPASLSVSALARHLGVSKEAVSKLLSGKNGLSADMAIRFEKLFGLKAETLLRMQAAYALAQARTHEDDIHVQPLPRAA